MFIPIFLYTLVLHYIPMFGIVMAFEDYDINKGYFKSPWVGMANFVELFSGSDFPRAIFNTVVHQSSHVLSSVTSFCPLMNSMVWASM